MKRFMDRKLGHRFDSRRGRYELFLSRVDTQLGSDGHFPLTPALSAGEREKGSQSFDTGYRTRLYVAGRSRSGRGRRGSDEADG